ncbi:hypothetical protein [Metabacillus indicus]|uniref:hypothetical protein n=1 Tax=Metabacillus indicus TaxID=246786 RepID=UPI000B23DE88|nr:hypothetical protein [Metabacillus indicus]
MNNHDFYVMEELHKLEKEAQLNKMRTDDALQSYSKVQRKKVCADFGLFKICF